jgi:CheY-like chemotaxis protein
VAKILYIEDDMRMQKHFVSAFKNAGHEVTACDDYLSARAQLKTSLADKKSFDIIVSDGQYPGDEKRFTAGKHQHYAGSACLLNDHKLLNLPMPVVVISGNAEFLARNPYPAECSQPLHLLEKQDFMPQRLAAEIPKFIAQAAGPRG